ncbi:uncharacterized protein LOC141525289 [Cotesia typhae]|uniref:uncharacterized protein LOC141525289 n=1 Tax=Cotesia typhae TaxID=2053667 RepID=UPI003D68BF01
MKQKENKDLILPLIVFYDDLETGNPLGSHAGINKLGAVYTSIATVPPTMSSRICLTTKADSEKQTSENETLIRKVEDYDEHAKDGYLEDKINLKEVCVWNDLPSYHAGWGHFANKVGTFNIVKLVSQRSTVRTLVFPLGS